MEIKAALEELNLYKKSQRKMAYIKSRIAELRERSSSLGSSGTVFVQGSRQKDDKIVELLDKIQNLHNELLDEEIYNLCIQNDIERKIYKLKEPYCSVLRGYYTEGKNLEKMAVELNYTFDGIKSIKYRGVKLYAELPDKLRENI